MTDALLVRIYFKETLSLISLLKCYHNDTTVMNEADTRDIDEEAIHEVLF